MMNTKEIFEYSKELSTITDSIFVMNSTLDHPSFSHTSIRNWCGKDILGIYFRCSDSPSGVLRVTGLIVNDDVKSVLHDRQVRVNLGPSRGDIAAMNPPATMTF